jgi:hypothetical protein
MMQDAYPTRYAFNTYASLIAIQLVLALVMPGLDQEGESPRQTHNQHYSPLTDPLALHDPQAFPFPRSTTSR